MPLGLKSNILLDTRGIARPRSRVEQAEVSFP
jgi:hypothetical protein